MIEPEPPPEEPRAGAPRGNGAAVKMAADLSLPLAQRLEAFEDFIDSEVGDTPLMRARNLEREFGLRQLYLKFEGPNPTGTQKDRIAFHQAMDALRRGFDTITVATCGNYGMATAFAAATCGLNCQIYIPTTYHPKRLRELSGLATAIHRVEGDYEAAVVHSQQMAEQYDWYDANPGGSNTPLQLASYGGISYEVYDELRDAPLALAVPVSNGTTLAGIYRGFLSLYRRGKTSRMPHLVAGSTFRKNPIVRAFIKGSAQCEDLKPEEIRGSKINEPLVNWHAIDGNHALDAVRNTGGWASDVADKAMASFSKLLRDKEGVHVLPASTAGLIALVHRHEKEPLANDRYVAVLTGRNA